MRFISSVGRSLHVDLYYVSFRRICVRVPYVISHDSLFATLSNDDVLYVRVIFYKCQQRCVCVFVFTRDQILFLSLF